MPRILVALSCALPLLVHAQAPDAPVKLESAFDADAVKFATVPGTATVTGRAALRLADGSTKSCAGFNVELLPVAAYSKERIGRTYGNLDAGQILLEQKPPKFTPDVKEYHDLLIKGVCDATGEFRFETVAAGEYFVIAFIIWDAKAGDAATKTGGAVMKRIRVSDGQSHAVRLE
jgi:hypothetical protein